MSGRFITFEGIDGAGKSTHIEPTAEALRAAGRNVVCTLEPGGTDLAERLRELVLHTAMDGVSESLLVFAARRDHITRVISPALARGDVEESKDSGKSLMPDGILDPLTHDQVRDLFGFMMPRDGAALSRGN